MGREKRRSRAEPLEIKGVEPLKTKIREERERRPPGWRVPATVPIGGHEVSLDVRCFFPEMPQDQSPPQTLVAGIYVDPGFRVMERGVVSAGRYR